MLTSWKAGRRLAAVVLMSLAACGGGDDTDTPAPPEPPVPPAPPVPPTPSVGDPLASEQWHLENRGQFAFAREAGTPGVDLNVQPAYQMGVFGQGVPVLVVDSGAEIRHEDLAANMTPSMLRSFDPRSPSSVDPTPFDGDGHGTAVAGIIGAVRDNGLGGHGVAPEALLGAVRYICDGEMECQSVRNLVDVLGRADFSRNAWVFNMSFGSEPRGPESVVYDRDAVLVAYEGLSLLREGRGALVVKAGGNEFAYVHPDPGEPPSEELCAPALALGVSCHNPGSELSSLAPTVLVVSSVNAHGDPASYASAGNSIFVAGLGGEFGVGEGFVTPEGTWVAEGPAVITTDLSGCQHGKASWQDDGVYLNLFDNPGSELAKARNADCRYTATMTGTSAAAPSVAGVLALMLSANPDLSWRDLRDILARTSRKDILTPAEEIRLPMADGEFVVEPSWQQNAAGLWHSSWYGFGLVDAGAAVAAARERPGGRLLGPMRSSGWRAAAADEAWLPVPPGELAGASRVVEISENVAVESVIVRLRLDGTANLGEVGVELLSPAGTRSLLHSPMSLWNRSPASSGLSGFYLTSHAFYGEPAQGEWRLRVVDVDSREATEPEVWLGGVSLLVRGG